MGGADVLVVFDFVVLETEGRHELYKGREGGHGGGRGTRKQAGKRRGGRAWTGVISIPAWKRLLLVATEELQGVVRQGPLRLSHGVNTSDTRNGHLLSRQPQNKAHEHSFLRESSQIHDRPTQLIKDRRSKISSSSPCRPPY